MFRLSAIVLTASVIGWSVSDANKPANDALGREVRKTWDRVHNEFRHQQGTLSCREYLGERLVSGCALRFRGPYFALCRQLSEINPGRDNLIWVSGPEGEFVVEEVAQNPAVFSLVDVGDETRDSRMRTAAMDAQQIVRRSHSFASFPLSAFLDQCENVQIEDIGNGLTKAVFSRPRVSGIEGEVFLSADDHGFFILDNQHDFRLVEADVTRSGPVNGTAMFQREVERLTYQNAEITVFSSFFNQAGSSGGETRTVIVPVPDSIGNRTNEFTPAAYGIDVRLPEPRLSRQRSRLVWIITGSIAAVVIGQYLFRRRNSS